MEHWELEGAKKKIARHYAGEQNSSTRERLIIQYIPLVKYVVNRMFSTLPSFVDRKDLFQAGIIGLIQALDQYDADRSVKLETYAVPRIRGAILDSLREMDWAPRSIRRKAVEVEKAISELEAELGRQPNESEVASKLGISLKDYQSLLGMMNTVRIFSLDHPFWISHGNPRSNEALHERVQNAPIESEITEEELKKHVFETLEALPDRERLILVLYYYEDLTLKEIATILNITESRVSQLHAQTILKIRTEIKKLGQAI